MKKRILALMAVVCLLLTGCGRNGPHVAIIAASDSRYSIELSQAIREALEEDGSDVTVFLPEDMSVEAQIEAFRRMIDKKVDLILISGVSINSFGEQLEEARDKGIRVITYDERLESDEPALQISPFYTWDTAEMYLAAIHDLLPEGGQFAILGTAAQDENSGVYPTEIRRVLENGTYPGLIYTEYAKGRDDTDICRAAVCRLLETYPDLNAILSLSLTGTRTAMDVLTETGGQADIRIVGIGDEELKNLCDTAGIQTRLFATDTKGFGSFIAHAAMAALAEDPTLSVGDTWSWADRQWTVWRGSGIFVESAIFPMGPTLVYRYLPTPLV